MFPAAAGVAELRNVDADLVLKPDRHQRTMAPSWVGERFFVVEKSRRLAIRERSDFA
jgi:hypothetical protein